MPAVRKASREQIIDAAVAVLRDDGFSAINARSVAKKLGCSTQPIYFSYGLAILANTDHLHLTETELREAFRREFRALTAIYGKPAKLPEFAVKAGVVL